MTASVFPIVIRDGLVVDYDPAYSASFNSSENRLLYSEELNNTGGWAQQTSTVTPNSAFSPTNTLTADSISSATDIGIFQGATTVIGTVYTASIFLNLGALTTATSIMFRDQGGSGHHVVVNRSTKALSAQTNLISSGIQDVGNGWWRLWMTYSATSTTGLITIRPDSQAGTTAIVAWGAQLERTRTVSTYTATTTSAITRSATLTNTVSALYPGTINGVVQYHPLGQGSFYFDNTAGNFVSVYTLPDTFWNAGSWSVSSWVRGDVLKSDNAVVGHGSSVGNGALHLGIRNAAVYFGFFGNDWSTGDIISANRWYHIVWIYDNAQKQKIIFVNGVQSSQSSLTGGVGYIGTGSNTEIGRYPWDPGYRMQGYIGRTQFYNRALGVSEVSQIFSSLAGRYGYGI